MDKKTVAALLALGALMLVAYHHNNKKQNKRQPDTHGSQWKLGNGGY